jgi:hypothetical protein
MKEVPRAFGAQFNKSKILVMGLGHTFGRRLCINVIELG